MVEFICPECVKPTPKGPCPDCGVQTIPKTIWELSNDPLVGKTIDGRYRIDKVLGRGGMGSVYLAVQVTMNRPVALKVIRPEVLGDPAHRMEIIRRFQREASTCSLLEHHNTVRVFDYGLTEDGVLFLAMELLRGATLTKLMKAGPMPAARVIRIAIQVCKSLAEAHNKGIIHRDLKPDNIMLIDASGDADFVKVLDFGIAKTVGESAESCLTGTGMIVGTPTYMAPEQGNGGAVVPATDLYCLGVIMYEALSGRQLFTGETPLAVMVKHITAVVPPLVIDGFPRDVPQALVDLVTRLLNKDPAKRVSSAMELAVLLDEIEIPKPNSLVISLDGRMENQQTKEYGEPLYGATTLGMSSVDTPQGLSTIVDDGGSGAVLSPAGSGRWKWLTAAAVLMVGLVVAAVVWIRPIQSNQEPGVHPTAPTPIAAPVDGVEPEQSSRAGSVSAPQPSAAGPVSGMDRVKPEPRIQLTEEQPVLQPVVEEVRPAPAAVVEEVRPAPGGVVEVAKPEPEVASAPEQSEPELSVSSGEAEPEPEVSVSSEPPASGLTVSPGASQSDLGGSSTPEQVRVEPAPAAGEATPQPEVPQVTEQALGAEASRAQAKAEEDSEVRKDRSGSRSRRHKSVPRKIPPCIRSKCPIGAECLDSQNRRIDGKIFCSDLAI